MRIREVPDCGALNEFVEELNCAALDNPEEVPDNTAKVNDFEVEATGAVAMLSEKVPEDVAINGAEEELASLAPDEEPDSIVPVNEPVEEPDNVVLASDPVEELDGTVLVNDSVEEPNDVVPVNDILEVLSSALDVDESLNKADSIVDVDD